MSRQRTPLKGLVRVPGDKSIGHRAVILGSIANGKSVIRNLSDGADNRNTRVAFESMGVSMLEESPGNLLINGVGLHGLRAASHPLDCGNSGTTMRLLCGLLAGQRFASTLVGDESLSRRPMGRVCKPLRNRGAKIDGVFDGSKNDEHAPITIRALPEGAALAELEYNSAVASAQVKTALIFSGLYSTQSTTVSEPVISRDHTERMLASMGVPIQRLGSAIYLDPSEWNQSLTPLDLTVASDPSSAAFILAAGALVPESRVGVRAVCMNPTRTGAFDVFRDMGCSILRSPKGDQGGEPIADLFVSEKSGELRSGAKLGGELAVRALDEVPILAAMAATVRAVTTMRDLKELRVKESDRIEAIAAMLRAFGRPVQTLPDGLQFEGGPITHAVIDSLGDHRIAMSATILALASESDAPTVVRDVDCVSTSFPGFLQTMRDLGATIEEQVS